MQAIAHLELRETGSNKQPHCTIKQLVNRSSSMSNQDGFTSGLVVGSVLGGIVGGVLGVVLNQRLSKETSNLQQSDLNPQQHNSLESENIETARLSLEDKIAQLNQAIDDVRHQLNTVNGNAMVERPNRYDGEER